MLSGEAPLVGPTLLGVPVRSADGEPVGALLVTAAAPRAWADDDVTALQALADGVGAGLELAAVAQAYASDRVRWDVAVQAADIGSFDWDLRTDRVDWDARMQALFGYVPGEFVPHLSEAFRRVHPDDRADVDAAVASAVASCGDYRAQFRVSLPDGGDRWLVARGRALCGADGTPLRLIGSCLDVTEARTARDEAAHLLATMVTGFVSLDRDWRVTYLNRAVQRVLGTTAEQAVGRVLWDFFPGLQESSFGRAYHRARDTGQPVVVEDHFPHLDAWYEVRAVPQRDGLHLYFLDVTARRADRRRAEESAARLELLATVSAELAATLDSEAAVARLARLVVPALADWCIVTLVEEDRLSDIGWWHADPALRPLVERYAALRIDALTDTSYVQRALDTGEPAIVADGAVLAVSQVLRPGEARDLLQQLAPESAAVLPLRARGRTVGLLTLFRSLDRGTLTDGDLATAQEVAVRAGLALDNARLYGQQRSLAEALQRSLLTDPPEPDHSEVVVRYVPAAETASVGGDWFDSFLQADGATTVVIGDVVGHDSQAAAAMGQVRGLLRGIAWYSGAGPADVLTGLDAAMEGLLVSTTATAVVARLEQTPEERERGTTRLRWSNAGHPPPMVVHADGTVEVLSGAEADLLLGIDPRTPRSEVVVTLERGATVLLYTDGLVERRGQSLDDGLELLRQALGDLADRTVDELCDELLARMLPRQAEDDVALVAVRLHDQSRPRPPEAGPNVVPPEVPPEP